MDIEVLELPHPRSSHNAGFCDVIYLPSQNSAVTGGFDGLLNVFSLNPENLMDDCQVLESKQQGALCCVAASGSKYICALSEDNTAALYEAKSLKFIKFLTRGSVLLTCGCFSPDETMVALGGEDGTLRVIDVDNVKRTSIVSIANAVTSGNQLCVQSVAWDPKGEWVVCSASNGNVFIYQLSEDDTLHLAQQLSGVTTRSADPHKLTWHPSGSLLAFPGIKNDVSWLERSSWRVVASLVSSQPSMTHIGPVTACAFSSRLGSHFATAGSDSRVLVWNTKTRAPVYSTGTNSCLITGLAWGNCNSGDLLLTNNAGQFYFCEGVIDPAEEELEKADAGAFVVDDDGAGYAEPMQPRAAEVKSLKSSRLHDVIEKWSKVATASADSSHESVLMDAEADTTFAIGKLQEPFQSGSTPIDGHRRYLALNMVGLVSCVKHDDHSTIYVELHDQAQHRPFQISDHYEFSLSYLHTSGVALASVGTKDTTSTLFYRPFTSWAGKGQWQHSLPDFESISCVAVTSLGVVVATNKHFLRFFSFSGIQTLIACLPGRPVCMAASGELLAVAFYPAQSASLSFAMYRVSDMHVMAQGPLPLSVNATLKWFYFAEDSNVLLSFDSAGVLRGVFLACGGVSVPLLETRTKLSNPSHERVWPIGVSEEQQLICVILRGGSLYPGFPKPIFSEIPLQLPFLNIDSAGGALEESLVRNNVFYTQATLKLPGVTSAPIDSSQLARQRIEREKSIVKLIQLACQQEDNLRAYDLATFLQTPKALNGAVQIARSKRMDRLAERIHTLLDGSERTQEKESYLPAAKKLKSLADENSPPV